MRHIFWLLLLPSLGWSAVGDKAPSLPTNLIATNPRLRPADTDATWQAYLDRVWNNANTSTCVGMQAWIKTDADNFPTNPLGSIRGYNGRHLVIALLAAKRHAGTGGADPACVATYLTKVQSVAANSLAWFNSTTFEAAPGLAVMYDWLYPLLDTTSRANFCSTFSSIATFYKNTLTGSNFAQPFSDVSYTQGQTVGLIPALAAYPNCGGTSRADLAFAWDHYSNYDLPTWHHIMARKGCVSAATSVDCGGRWTENYEDYWASTATSQTAWVGPQMNAVAWATNNFPGYFTTDQAWFKGMGWWLPYELRPDLAIFPVGLSSNNNALLPEIGNVGTNGGEELDTFGVLAEAYNEPAFRGIYRLSDWQGATPNGLEPSAWPWGDPDSSAKTAVFPWSYGSTVALTRNFPSAGEIVFASNWTEDGTKIVLRYGADDYWTHSVQDAGAIIAYSRGTLLGRSGLYRPGSNSEHVLWYAQQAISQNTALFYDVNDRYATETYHVERPASHGGSGSFPNPNDGGQRRTGSGYNAGGGAMQSWMQGPYDVAQWWRSRELYHKGGLIAYAVDPTFRYSYAAVDITAAYNNYYSHTPFVAAYRYDTANTPNRSYRVQKYVRHLLFIPHGNSAYLVVYDQMITTASSIVKTLLWHFVNQPTTSTYSCGGATCQTFTASRTETVGEFVPWTHNLCNNLGLGFFAHSASSCTQYTYSGQVTGWVPWPTAATTSVIGGPGAEFQITDSSGTINANGCMPSSVSVQCTPGFGTGSTTDILTPLPNQGPFEALSYRIEVGMGGSNLSDNAIHVFWLHSTADTTTVTTPPSTSVSGTNLVTTFGDTATGGTCAYTVTFPQNGTGGAVTATGAGCASVIN